jgi:hypothetical protein
LLVELVDTAYSFITATRGRSIVITHRVSTPTVLRVTTTVRINTAVDLLPLGNWVTSKRPSTKNTRLFAADCRCYCTGPSFKANLLVALSPGRSVA